MLGHITEVKNDLTPLPPLKQYFFPFGLFLWQVRPIYDYPKFAINRLGTSNNNANRSSISW